jgi:hypothetical protein
VAKIPTELPKRERPPEFKKKDQFFTVALVVWQRVGNPHAGLVQDFRQTGNVRGLNAGWPGQLALANPYSILE